MGIDFIRRSAPSFRKALDMRRVELATPDLFSRKISTAPRAYAASLRAGEGTTVGEKLSVCLKGDQILALRGLHIVAQFQQPPTELMTEMQASFGEACGEVRVVHELASVAEITISW